MKSLRGKMLLGSVFLSLLVLFSVIAVSFYTSQDIVVEISKRQGMEEARAYAEEMSGWMLSQGTIIRELAVDIENIGILDREHLENLLSKKLATRSEVIDFYVGLNNKDFFSGDGWVPPSDYDCTQRGWYTAAVEKGDIIYTAPYLDATTFQMIITVAIPLKQNDSVVGVVASDIFVDYLTERVASISNDAGIYGILLDANKNVVVHPDKALQPYHDAAIDDTVTMNFSEAVEGTFGEIALPVDKPVITRAKDLDGKVKYFAFAPLRENGWSLGVVIPQIVFFAPMITLIVGFLIAMVVSLVVAVIFAYYWANSFVKPINRVKDQMAILAQGDLTQRIPVKGRDEIAKLGESYNQTLDNLSALVQGIKGVSTELTVAAQGLAATSQETSASADEVGRTVEEIAKGAQDQARDAERGAMLGRNLAEKFEVLAGNTSEMLKAAQALQEANNSGVDAVDGLMMKNLAANDAYSGIQDVINALSNNTQVITTILDSISAISVQTNLLALNASIEAARAGEHGRGFAVVAEEIRKLAEASASAAAEVRTIVGGIQTDSLKSTKSMEQLTTIASEQNIAVALVLEAFGAIGTAYGNIAGSITSMELAVSELSRNKDEIINSIENISAVSEETAAAAEEVTASMEQQVCAVEEVANSADHLNGISVNLTGEIEKFKL